MDRIAEECERPIRATSLTCRRNLILQQ